MKRNNIFIPLLLFIFAATLSAQIPEKFQGRWDFDFPYDLDGYETGHFIITKDSVIVNYDSVKVELTAEWFDMKSDTLNFGYFFRHFMTNLELWLVHQSDSAGYMFDNHGHEGPIIRRKE